MSQSVAREVVAHGRVHGVFFRDSCRRAATEAGVRGWVRNEPDGTVRAWFEGQPQAVEQMVTWARSGPPSASVRHLDVTEAAPQGLEGFEVRF